MVVDASALSEARLRIHDAQTGDVTGCNGSSSDDDHTRLVPAADMITLSDGLPLKLPAILGVSQLPYVVKIVFLATNIPYFLMAGITFAARIPTSTLFECASELCAWSAFHGTLLMALATISTYWHAAQCQLWSWLFCRDRVTGIAALHSPKWLKRLLLSDVACALLTISVGVICFGPMRTFSWLAVPLGVFALSAIAKRRRAHALYAAGHGAWHLLSAVAISQIVMNSQPLHWGIAGPQWLEHDQLE